MELIPSSLSLSLSLSLSNKGISYDSVKYSISTLILKIFRYQELASTRRSIRRWICWHGFRFQLRQKETPDTITTPSEITKKTTMMIQVSDWGATSWTNTALNQPFSTDSLSCDKWYRALRVLHKIGQFWYKSCTLLSDKAFPCFVVVSVAVSVSVALYHCMHISAFNTINRWFVK